MPVAEGRILIDTNVLIYATLESDPRSTRAREVLLGSGVEVERYVSVQNLAEMYPNLTGPKTHPPDSPEAASAKVESIALLKDLHVLPLTADIVRLTLELCARYGVRRQRYFDMQLVATMMAHGIPLLVTENVTDFEDVEEIRAESPF